MKKDYTGWHQELIPGGEFAAGESLGRQVAAIFATRARNDGAGKAGGSPAIWKNFETITAAKGEQFWVSLETPKRPPMLPLFSKVMPFLFDSTTVAAIRPPAPYATNSAEFKKKQKKYCHLVKTIAAIMKSWLLSGPMAPVLIRLQVTGTLLLPMNL
ncbi:hypothetical protein ACFJIV_09210 [Mucilaginibacter sp. UC70_90]